VLIHGDLEIFDSTQIFEYLEEIAPAPRLWPAGVAPRTRARLLELKSDEVYFPHIIRLMGLQTAREDPAAIAAREAASRFYEAMEGELAGKDYLAGPFSYADIAFYMAQFFGDRMGAAMSEATPNLIRWRARMTERPAVRTVIGAMAKYLLSIGRRVPAFVEGAM
jgi:glutathione S-transferase